MTRHYINQVRVWCDACGSAMVEEIPTRIDRALEEGNWIHRIWAGREEDLCPMCRPDCAYDALERVQEEIARQIMIMGREGEWGDGMYHMIDAINRAIENHS